MPEGAEHSALALLGKVDPLRYPAVLFLPEGIRDHAAALWAFHAETLSIPDRVSEPTPGEIRLQWWREVLLSQRQEEAAASPLASALLAVISQHGLPAAGFERYLDARIFDLYNDPMPDRTALEAWAGETESFIFQMIAILASGGSGQATGSLFADACGHGGVAAALASLLRSLAIDRQAGRGHVPDDLLSACGLDRAEWQAGPGLEHERHEAVITGLCAMASEHLANARSAIGQLPREIRPAFLPLALVPPTLKRVRRLGSRLLDAPIVLNPVSVNLAYWKTALRGV